MFSAVLASDARIRLSEGGEACLVDRSGNLLDAPEAARERTSSSSRGGPQKVMQKDKTKGPGRHERCDAACGYYTWQHFKDFIVEMQEETASNYNEAHTVRTCARSLIHGVTKMMRRRDVRKDVRPMFGKCSNDVRKMLDTFLVQDLSNIFFEHLSNVF